MVWWSLFNTAQRNRESSPTSILRIGPLPLEATSYTQVYFIAFKVRIYLLLLTRSLRSFSEWEPVT